MNSALSLLTGAALAGLDLLGLSWFAKSLGKQATGLARGLMLLFLFGKFGVLALAILAVKNRAWFELYWFAGGLGLPFLAFFILESKKHVNVS